MCKVLGRVWNDDQNFKAGCQEVTDFWRLVHVLNLRKELISFNLFSKSLNV